MLINRRIDRKVCLKVSIYSNYKLQLISVKIPPALIHLLSYRQTLRLRARCRALH